MFGTKKEKKKKYNSKMAEWLDALIFAVVVAGFIRVFFFQAYRIPTESMEATQLAGDFLFVNHFVYGPQVPFTNWRIPGFWEPERGDIIVFVYPKDPDFDYIKRCVAVGGDTVEIRNKQLYVNGREFANPPKALFSEDTLRAGLSFMQDLFPKRKQWNTDNYGPLYVPAEGDVIPMNASTFLTYQDLIIYDTNRESKPRLVGNDVYLDGKILKEWTVRQNYYFMMGDNRNNSQDSRFWGFVPFSHIKGKPLFTYWSWDPNISFANPIDLIASIRWSRIGRPIE